MEARGRFAWRLADSGRREIAQQGLEVVRRHIPGAQVAIVRRIAPHEWAEYRAVRLRALADSPESFGSTLDQETRRANSDWQRRLAPSVPPESDLPLAVVEGERFVGLAWGKIWAEDPETAHVFQMWVAPEHRRRGHARRLLDHIIMWARSAGALRVILDVARGATAAERLYARAGFEPSGPMKPLRPGSELLVQPMSLSLRRGAV